MKTLYNSLVTVSLSFLVQSCMEVDPQNLDFDTPSPTTPQDMEHFARCSYACSQYADCLDHYYDTSTCTSHCYQVANHSESYECDKCATRTNCRATEKETPTGEDFDCRLECEGMIPSLQLPTNPKG